MVNKTSLINTVQTSRLPILNEIQVKSATFMNRSFPLHFHKDWSLGFIEAGSEYISFTKSDILMSKNTQILIPPYSLHKNWGGKNSAWTYKAVYINCETISYLAKDLKLDYSVLADIPYFIYRRGEKLEMTRESILRTLKHMFLKSNNGEFIGCASKQKEFYLNEILNYLAMNFNSKITLDNLEHEFKINKFKLLRNFRNKVGISPLEYQMSIRIEKSKQLFFEDLPLTHIALESGFFDQSHFTHSFKKYVGVTPGKFKSNCNILQDQESFMS